MNKARLLVCLIALVGLLFLAGCSGGSAVTPTASPSPLLLTPTPAQSPTPVAPRSLTICLADEPTSLNMYANLTPSSRSVLSAIYDGPIDTNSYAYQPVILKDLPSLENGDALLETVMVREGDRVVDSNGLPVSLTAGTSVLPSGCTSEDCAVIYDGYTDIQMDQMVVTFTLLPGLTWSDGEALTADDSVYSYELASSSETSASRYLVDRTLSYEAVDDLTVQWWGRPGYVDPSFVTNFFTPAPRHAWQDHTAAELPTLEAASRYPLGWGPYVLDKWLTGESIHLVKNAHYFRAKDGLPAFDDLTFRFVPDPNLAISLLIAGTCDLLDPGIALDDQVELLKAFDANGQLTVQFSSSMNLEQLAFGILPASYDENFSPAEGDRPDLFSDKRTRQAFAYCLDRQKVVDQVLYGLSEVPSSFIPSEHPQYDPNVSTYEHDPQAGSRLLEQVGWKDTDNNPLTIRTALGIPGVPDGTPLKVTYLTTGALQRRQVSQILASSLAECGVQVEVQYMDPLELYRIGADQPLFGRQFDLAEYALAGTGLVPPCNRYLSSEVPSSENNWMGINFSGYQEPSFDNSCRSANASLSPETSYSAVQELFSEDLPVIPLYWQVKIAAARVGLCGFQPDPTASSSLWNIEQFSSASQCPED